MSPVERPDIAVGRLRTGRIAHVLDVCAGGALIETDCRLLPGMRVELQLGEPVPVYRVKGRILRCHVASLDRGRVRYRGALAFEEPLRFSESTAGKGTTHG